MSRSVPAALACLLALLSAGCVFSKKERPPKENPAISADVEAQFRQRWLDRRVSELTAQGKTASAARTQAESEFRAHFDFPDRAMK